MGFKAGDRMVDDEAIKQIIKNIQDYSGKSASKEMGIQNELEALKETVLVGNRRFDNKRESVKAAMTTYKANYNSIIDTFNHIMDMYHSMSSIVYRFYGKYDVSKIEKIKQANNLSSSHKLSIGQKLIIPLD